MSCSIEIKASFPEEGSGAFGYALTGLNDEAVTPNSFTWTLTDVNGAVINSRLNVVVTPAVTTWILLEGDDLAVATASNIRVLTVKGTYDTELGSIARLNVPYTEEIRFDICRFINIP